MDTLSTTFEERLQEIETYLDLLTALEQQAGMGAPKIGGSLITAQQQRILYSAVYLQLYNLIEATVTWCLDAVLAATTEDEKWQPAHLTNEVRKEWVRAAARVHVEMNPQTRLEYSVKMCDQLVQALPVLKWKLDKIGGGNWDENDIQNLTERLGCRLQISPRVFQGVKKHVRDNKGALALVKDYRNRLAHGNLSFSECGEGVSVSDLRDLKQNTAAYLREVVAAFTSFVTTYEYLAPEHRPGGDVA